MAYLDPKQVKGTTACQKSSGRVQAYEARRCGTRVIWRKLDCLNPILQMMQGFHPPEMMPETGAVSCDSIAAELLQPSGYGAISNEGIQGDERGA